MPQTMSNAARSLPVRTTDGLGPGQAKAGLRSDRIGLSLIAVTKDAVIRHYGSVKAAAISLSVDPSLMMREFDAGKFHRLDKADDETKAAIAQALSEAFGAGDPKARVQRLIREGRRVLDELAEAL